MSGNINWYTLIPERDRRVVNAAAKWLSPVSWQWFVTLTFPWSVKGETADAKLKEWLNRTERTLRTRVCFVAGKERKPCAHGIEAPWHFHILVTAAVAIPQGLLAQSWMDLVSHGARHLRKDAAVEDSALVESYNQDRLGAEYALKSMNTCIGDWHFRWLELFHPRMKQTSSPNHIKNRQRARFGAQRGDEHCAPSGPHIR